MSGKKQSQRTKNNVRPSSSSRSAELLNHSMSFDGGLMTVSGGKVLPALFPTLATVNFDQGLKSEYQICIKKLNKKDPITRTKALQELSELVNNGNVDDAVAVLPAWAHCYKILTSDTDRKVREMTQLCHGALLRACGRRAAPQLKALLAPWLQAQHDEHAPAMSHAHHSLKSTFPESKLPDVLSFCKLEIMAHLLDNLIGNTEAIISKKIEDLDEREQQMGRIITGSLRGLEFFVPQLPAKDHEWLWAELAPLLAAPAFWKMSNYTMPLVRAAWFGAVGRLAERFGARWGAAHGPRALRVLLGAARDQHALVAAQRWACLLQLMHHVPDWQKYVDKKELLVKRILDLLEAGGWGNAKQLSTMLLPLLAYLPQDVLTKEFYETFFRAIYKGFETKNVIISKSERQSWITSLAECLRYVSIQKNEFAEEVVANVHRTWLERTLSVDRDATTRNNLVKCSAANMTSLVKYWLKQSDEGESEKYDALLKNFWHNVELVILAQVKECGVEEGEIETLIDAHILLLQSLKTSFSQETKKQLSIKFEETAGERPESVAGDTPAASRECDPSRLQRYERALEEVVHGVIAAYLEAAEELRAADAILTPLMTLLRGWRGARAFDAVAARLGAGSALGLHARLLRPWLAADRMRCEAVVDVVFLLIEHLDERDRDAVFDSFRELPPPAREWCVARCVAHPHVRTRAARRWLRAPAAAHVLSALARRAFAAHDCGAAHLLLACLADAPHAPHAPHAPDQPLAPGESLFGEDAVAEMLSTVSAAVARVGETEAETEDEAEADGSAVEFCGRLAARLVTALAPSPERARLRPFSELVLRLLNLNVIVPRGDARLPAATWCEMRSSWRDGLAALQAPARRALLQQTATLLTVCLDSNIDKLDVQKIEDIVCLAPYLFIRGDESQLPDDLTEIITFTKHLFDLDTEESVAVETCALRHECITLQLNCLYEDNDITKTIIEGSAETDLQELSKLEATAYMNKLLFRAIYLRTMLLHKAASEDDADDSDAKTWCDTLFNSQYLESEFCKILYDYTIVLSLHEAYTFWPDYSIIEKTKSKMDAILSDVISGSSEASRQKVVTSLKKLASSKGYYWAYAHRYYCVSARKEAEQGALWDADEKIEEPTTTAHFHMLQARNKFGGTWEDEYRTAFLVMLRGFQERHGEQLSTELLVELEASKASCDVDVIARHYGEQGYALFDESVRAAPWSALLSGAGAAHFLRLALRGGARPAPWPFVNPVLDFLFRSVTNSLDQWGSVKMGVVLLAALRLLDAVLSPAPAPAPDAPLTPPTPPPHCAWKEYENDVYDAIYTTVAHILEHGQSRCVTVAQSAALGALVAVLGRVDWYRAGRAARGEAEGGGLALAGARSLQRPAHPAARYLAHALLCSLAKPLVYHDAQQIIAWSENEEEKERPATSLDAFRPTFEELQQIVETTLNNVVLGDEICELVSMSDSHSMTLGWLLLADAQAHMWDLAMGDLKQIYIHIYTQHNYVSGLLAAALRLLPGDAFEWARAASDKAPAPPHCGDAFLRAEPFSMRSACSSAAVGALACRCVQRTVAGAGCGGARAWLSVAPARAALALERLVVAYVSPAVVHEQFAQLQRRAHEIEDATVRIAWAAREVVCEFNVEESVVELQLWLARAHPLTPPRLEASGLSGAATAPWLALYLTYQNGTLLNALKIWTKAVNMRVEKAPQCYICYCRLEPASGRLPNATCHQCRNKFHSGCLRKWFATSNKSNCPLCRTVF